MSYGDEIKNLAQTIDANQRQLLKQTYQVMDSNIGANGMAIFARLFQEYPDYKGLFPRLRHIHDSVLFTTGEMSIFAQLYMDGLRTIIHSLDDDQVLTQTLEKIAAIHKRKHVETHHLQNMLPMVIATMRSGGAKIDQDVEQAWAQLFNVIAQIIEMMKKQKKK